MRRYLQQLAWLWFVVFIAVFVVLTTIAVVRVWGGLPPGWIWKAYPA